MNAETAVATTVAWILLILSSILQQQDYRGKFYAQQSSKHGNVDSVISIANILERGDQELSAQIERTKNPLNDKRNSQIKRIQHWYQGIKVALVSEQSNAHTILFTEVSMYPLFTLQDFFVKF
jgi:hypothetical protein